MINDELLRALLNHTQRQNSAFVEYVLHQYNMNILEPGVVSDLMLHHSDEALPDSVFLTDSQNVNICIHNSSVNGIVHSHNFFELVYVAKGTITEEVDGEELLMHTGTVCIHNPRALHQIKKCKDSDCLINIIIRKEIFEENVFLPIIHNKALSSFFLRYTAEKRNTNYMLFQKDNEQIDMIIHLLIMEFMNSSPTESLILSLIFLLFGTLLKGYSSDSFTDKLLLYISDHLQTATLQECAEYFSYHEKYFCSLIKKHMGRSFSQIHTELRIKRAKDLLKFTDLSISDISFEIGYNDPSVFYKNFKKVTDLTPAEFRLQEASQEVQDYIKL